MLMKLVLQISTSRLSERKDKQNGGVESDLVLGCIIMVSTITENNLNL